MVQLKREGPKVNEGAGMYAENYNLPSYCLTYKAAYSFTRGKPSFW